MTDLHAGQRRAGKNDSAHSRECVWLCSEGPWPFLFPYEPRVLDPADWGRKGGNDQVPEKEPDWKEEEEPGRAFLFKELVLSALTEDHLELSPRPPDNYIGLDYVRTFTPSSGINKRYLPEGLPLTAMTLHPRLLYDRKEEGNGLTPVRFAPQDFWLRFNPGGRDRLALRVGQFVIPYGVNPILAPRQRFILPVESTDLGLKWDWGVGLKGPAGRYDWEIAATIGSGEALHSSHLFGGSDRTSYLFTGRIGAPTYWDFQYGFSFLYGDLPDLRGAKVFSEVSISRWRAALDTFYKYGTYLMVGGQLSFGQDGFAGDDRFVRVTGGETADVLGFRAWADWVIPKQQDLHIGAQFESVVRDLSTSNSDDTAMIFEVGYSFTTSISAMIDYRVEWSRAVGRENDAIFFTFVFYGN